MKGRMKFVYLSLAFAIAAFSTLLGVDLSDLEEAILGDGSVVATESSASETSKTSADQNADFEFYLLALSWSPTYCSGGRPDPQQCGAGKSYSFITHGLWPQNERGFPANCDTDEPAEVTRAIETQMLDIMPSRGLIRHQWRKHGTCSGLSQRDYFAKVRAATERIDIPAQFKDLSKPRRLAAREVENAFAVSNSALDTNEMAVRCDRQKVKEVRICLTKGLEPRACREVDARGCQRSNLELPPPN